MDLNRYSRQTAYEKIGAAGQEKLLSSRVAVVGIGALGTQIANNLCRSGVGYIRLIDRDYVELSNVQRQVLFDEDDVLRQTPKAAAACEHLKKINSEITMEPVVADVNSSNIEQFCSGVDLVLDGSDNMELRYLINEQCIKSGVPWIYGGALMAGGASMNILPGKSPCFRCIFPDSPPPGSYPTCSTAGVLNMASALVASVESVEAIKILLGSPDIRKTLLIVDLWQNVTDYLEVESDPLCPVCGEHRYELLGKLPRAFTTVLCGRDAIQVVPGSTVPMDFTQLAEKLQKIGTVKQSSFSLSFDDGHIAFQVFPDGRAIIQNVQDENTAKTIYSEYIGF
jgi:adenylyltransferase/sulfurtransferase